MPVQVPPIRPAPRLRLTPRQEQIVKLVAAGLGDKEIACRLGLAPNTVRTHLQRLFRECGLHNRAEAAAKWVALQDTRDTVQDQVVDNHSGGSGTRPSHRRWPSVSLPVLALLAAGLAIFAVPPSSLAIMKTEVN